MSGGRSAARFSVVAVLVAVSPMLSRMASGAEPAPVDCLKAHEDSIGLKNSHHLRATREKLSICSSESCPAEIRLECLGRVREVDAEIPTIVFEVKDAAGADLVDVTVKMDGELLTKPPEGTALPIDPGRHTFTFEAVGRPSIQRQLVIFEGDKERRERVAFEAVSAPKPVSASPVPPRESDALALPTPAGAPKTPPGGARTLALALGGIGVAAAGVGAVFGGIAISRHNKAAVACPNNPCKDESGVALWNEARSAGNISTGAFFVAAAALAGGLTLWLLERPVTKGAPGTKVGLGPRGVEWSIRW